MATGEQATPPFPAARAVGWLGGFAAFGVGLSALYAASGFGLPCPFRALTGWSCPLCGGTRLGAALLQLDLGAAFAANPVVLLGLALLTVLGVLWTAEALGGPAVRLPRVLAGPVRRLRPNHWLVLALLASTVYVLSRNLP